ncbi:MAG TPA: hypothetical protein VK916_05230 [Gillisia sp.]|nr:hypothetical protein [Gillisia sp.]HSJ12064.1 hypothetical protein [Gillisia sp.]HSP82460.1 hypothetical protein [Gillisia sp.]
MKNYTILFLILTGLTGLIGFAGLHFKGIEFVRITFLIFADILIISVLARLFFANSRKMKLQRIRK